MKGLLVVHLAILTLLGLWTTASEAHAALVGSAPARRATVTAPPERVVLTFNERLEPAFTRASVWNTSGEQVDLRNAAVDPRNPKVVTVSLPPLLPGLYTVRYRILSVDGHIVESSFPFTIASPARRR